MAFDQFRQPGFLINGSGQPVIAALAGEANTASATASYVRTFSPASTIILSGTSAVTIGSSAQANDTMLLQVTILSNASAVTATIAGMADQTNTAQNIVLTGSTTADVVYAFPCGLINGKGTLQITPSVTLKVVVGYVAI